MADSKGRTDLDEMSDRELLIEVVQTLRTTQDALEAAMENPMLKAMMPKATATPRDLLSLMNR